MLVAPAEIESTWLKVRREYIDMGFYRKQPEPDPELQHVVAELVLL